MFERHFVLLILDGKGAVVSFFAARDSARVYRLSPNNRVVDAETGSA
jgi:hypothetical protein